MIRPPTLQSNFGSPLNSPSSFPALSSPLTQPAASPAPSTLSGYSSPQPPSAAQAQNLFLASHSLPSFDSLPSPTGSVGSAGQRGRGRPKGSKNKRGKDEADAPATPSGVQNASSSAMPPPTPPSQQPSWGVPHQQQTPPVFQVKTDGPNDPPRKNNTVVSRFSGLGPSPPKCPLNRDSPLNGIIPIWRT